ncbi:MAG: aldolase [Pseudomonadota bacterium]
MRYEKQREDLAATLRLAERFDLHEGICNHFSLQIARPDAEGDEHYLINPYGLHWSEITPDAIILMDGDGATLEGDGEAEATARNIHIAGHRANPRHVCILHTHMPHATALTMLKGGRLEMAHQTACRFHGRLAYEDEFGGLAHDAEEGERIAQQAKSNAGADVVFLANHGVVVGGPSAAHAFDDLYYLERACRQQVLAQSTGQPLNIIPDNVVAHTAVQFYDEFDRSAVTHFEALKRVIGF